MRSLCFRTRPLQRFLRFGATCGGAHLLQGNQALTLGRAHATGTHEAAQGGVALPVLREHDKRATPAVRELNGELRADDEPDSGRGQSVGLLPKRCVRLDDSVDTVAIGERHGRKPQLRGTLHELGGMARSFQEGVGALNPEGNVPPRTGGAAAHSTTPWTRQRFCGSS